MRKIQFILAIPVAVAAIGCGGSSNSLANRSTVIGLWTTTSTPSGSTYVQVDRLARPAVNELFATVANDHHKINDEVAPKDDHLYLQGDIDGFLQFPAGRSPEIRKVITSVLVPDVIKFDLSKMDSAAYLGVETGGATGGKFGGRKLTDDVIDISLGVVFGNTIPALGLAPDDGKEIPSLTTDNVDASGKHFTSSFPYLGSPR